MPAKYALLIVCTATLFTVGWGYTPVSSTMHEPLSVLRESLQQERAHTEDTKISEATQAQAHATLLVLEHRYPISLRTDKTVLVAMQDLASSETLAFTGREFPSLGFFVESINGIRNVHSKYWILYRNGAQSQVGVSNATISPGDVIEWRYE